MHQLDSKPTLTSKSQAQLTLLQKEIDKQPSFAKKVSEAQNLWKTKGGKDGKETFDEVKKKLTDMCVSVGMCCYCEHGEVTDIEHIAPKSFYPQQTFVWENYLLACKTCNSGYKLDKCYVIDSHGKVKRMVRKREPPHGVIYAFINPRTENPNDYLILNLESFTFDIIADPHTVAFNKAAKTCEILDLNRRDILIKGRERIYDKCYNDLCKLCQILKANTISEIESLLTPKDDLIDSTQTLEQIKTTITQGYKKKIQQLPHPSVWYAIKQIESKVSPQWQRLFQQLPEALTW